MHTNYRKFSVGGGEAGAAANVFSLGAIAYHLCGSTRHILCELGAANRPTACKRPPGRRIADGCLINTTSTDLGNSHNGRRCSLAR
jgi:hypothetical protein